MKRILFCFEIIHGIAGCYAIGLEQHYGGNDEQHEQCTGGEDKP